MPLSHPKNSILIQFPSPYSAILKCDGETEKPELLTWFSFIFHLALGAKDSSSGKRKRAKQNWKLLNRTQFATAKCVHILELEIVTIPLKALSHVGYIICWSRLLLALKSSVLWTRFVIAMFLVGKWFGFRRGARLPEINNISWSIESIINFNWIN